MENIILKLDWVLKHRIAIKKEYHSQTCFLVIEHHKLMKSVIIQTCWLIKHQIFKPKRVFHTLFCFALLRTPKTRQTNDERHTQARGTLLKTIKKPVYTN